MQFKLPRPCNTYMPYWTGLVLAQVMSSHMCQVITTSSTKLLPMAHQEKV